MSDIDLGTPNSARRTEVQGQLEAVLKEGLSPSERSDVDLALGLLVLDGSEVVNEEFPLLDLDGWPAAYAFVQRVLHSHATTSTELRVLEDQALTALRAWEVAADGGSDDAEHAAAVGLVAALRGLLGYRKS